MEKVKVFLPDFGKRVFHGEYFDELLFGKTFLRCSGYCEYSHPKDEDDLALGTNEETLDYDLFVPKEKISSIRMVYNKEDNLYIVYVEYPEDAALSFRFADKQKAADLFNKILNWYNP